MELSIVAHIDLPGHYRIIRVFSPILAETIQAGDALFIPALGCELPYFRLDKKTSKIDFLFYLTDKTRHIGAHFLLKAVELKPAHASLMQSLSLDTKEPAALLRILACDLTNLGCGLSLALDEKLNKKIDLFIFEIDCNPPFPIRPSKIYLPYMTGNVIGNFVLLEEKKIAGRLHSMEAREGCFHGSLPLFIEHIESGLRNTRLVKVLSLFFSEAEI